MTSDPNQPSPTPQQYASPTQPYGGYDPAAYAAMYGGAYGGMYGAPMRHSGLGIASFIISLIVGIALTVMVVMAAVMVVEGGGELNEKSSSAIILGCSFLVGLILAFIGAILGGISLMQKDRKRLFGILGLCFNIGTLLLVGILMLVGLLNK